MSSSFLKYYTSLGISPVSQNINNIYLQFLGREHLYLSCGVWPESIEGKNIIEFGPGGGFNSIYTASLNPKRYTLVEGNPVAQDQIRGFIKNKLLPTTIDLCANLFEEVTPTATFDLVIAEGCIPHQSNPKAVLQHISKFVKPGGLLLTTAISATSYLSEIFRRLVPNLLGINHRDSELVLSELHDFYALQLNALPHHTRSVNDWVLDNIVQDLENRELFSMAEVVSELEEEFAVVGTSPSLAFYKNWYKSYANPQCFQTRAVDARMVISAAEAALLDLRCMNFQLDPGPSAELSLLSEESWLQMKEIQKDNAEPEKLSKSLGKLIKLTETVSPQTATSLKSFERFLYTKDLQTLLNPGSLIDWWGRGQQYVTLRRNPPWYTKLKIGQIS